MESCAVLAVLPQLLGKRHVRRGLTQAHGDFRYRRLGAGSWQIDGPSKCQKILACKAIVLAVELKRHPVAGKARKNTDCDSIVKRREANGRELT